MISIEFIDSKEQSSFWDDVYVDCASVEFSVYISDSKTEIYN